MSGRDRDTADGVDLVYRHSGRLVLAFSDSEQCYCLIQRQMICCSFNPLFANQALSAGGDFIFSRCAGLRGR